MPNYAPFLILALSSLLTLIFLLFRTKSYKTLILFLSFAGMIYVFEYVIFVLFDSYVYYPKLLSNAYLDSNIGALISNFVTVPTIALVIVVFKLRTPWMIGFSLFLTSVEWLFVKLDIFAHHWWKLPYTFVALLLFFWFVRFWTSKEESNKRLFTYTTLLTFTMSMVATMIFILILTGVRRFEPGVFENASRDDIFFSFPYGLIKSLLLINAVYWTTKKRWLFIALTAIFFSNYMLIQFDLLKIYISTWLYYLIYMPCCLLTAGLVYMTMRYFRKRQRHP